MLYKFELFSRDKTQKMKTLNNIINIKFILLETEDSSWLPSTETCI